ncbi:MAG TPA: GAF domain-containing protein [Polyangiaceae bacterium]
MSAKAHGESSASTGERGVFPQQDDSRRQLEERGLLLGIDAVEDYAIILLDPEGRILTWNRGAQRIKGYEAHEIIGQHFSRLYPPDDVRSGQCDQELEFASREGRFEDEGWRLRKDGTRFWANVIITAVRDGERNLLGFVKVTRDLTERVKAEENARRLSAEKAAHAASEASLKATTFLARASEMLASTLDYESTLRAVARLVVPALADNCVVDFVDGDGTVRRVAEAAATPRNEALLRELRRFPPGPTRRSPALEVIGTGKTVYIPKFDSAALDNITAGDEYSEIVRQIAPRSSVSVPLRADGRTLGAITFGMAESGRSYGKTDIELAEELGRRGGAAIQNSLLFRVQIRATERTARLQRTTAALAEARTAEEAGRAVIEQAREAFAANTAAVYLVDKDGRDLRRLAAIGHLGEGTEPEFPLLPLSMDVPAARSVRDRRDYFLESREQVLERFSDARSVDSSGSVQATVNLALVVKGNAIGVLVLSFAVARRFSQEDRHFAEAMAQQCAQAIDRALLLERERKNAERSAFLARAGERFASSLDPEKVLQDLVQLVVPTFGDWCAVELVDGDSTRCLAVAHVDPDKVKFAWEVRRKYPPERHQDRGTFHVIDTGMPELYADIPAQLLEQAAKNEEHLELLRKLGMRSAALVPLWASGRTLGVISLYGAESGHAYDQGDIEFLMELAHRAALALERSRFLEAEQAARIEAERAAERLTEALRIREDFLAIAGHELKTPLSALLLHIQSLERAVRANMPLTKLDERLEKASHAGLRLENLINEMLDFSRIAAGRLRLEPETFELGALVRETVERFSEQAMRARAPISLQAPPDVVGVWDRLRIDQVLSNLIANAIKYGRGKPIDVSLAAEADEVVIRVVDRGIGIEPNQQKKIFDRFERAVGAREFGGFGLGLWISRQIVEASGGRIEVASTLGQGSTFTVRLPMQPKDHHD